MILVITRVSLGCFYLCELVSIEQDSGERSIFSRPIILPIFGMRVYLTQGCPLRSPVISEGLLVAESLLSNKSAKDSGARVQ